MLQNRLFYIWTQKGLFPHNSAPSILSQKSQAVKKFFPVLRVNLSHAHLSRIVWRELAHRQTHSSEDAYGECRDSSQACACEPVGMA